MIKKFMMKTLIFASIFFLINVFPHFFIRSFSGNEFFAPKWKYYKNRTKIFNTVLFGSSRIYRQINPVLLDSYLKNEKVKSFNLGAQAVINPESYSLFEALLALLPPNTLKYAVLELSVLEGINKKNLFSYKSYYWLNYNYLILTIQQILRAPFPEQERNTKIMDYIKSYLYKMIYSLYDLGKKKFFASPSKSEVLGSNKDGFYALDDEIEKVTSNSLIALRRKAFLKNLSALSWREKTASKVFSTPVNYDYLNKIHLKIVQNLLKISRDKGIYLFLLIPPRLKSYKELVALKAMLPKEHVIELANPNKYPEFYTIKNSFDIGHLNKKGSHIFTKYLSKAIKKRLSIFFQM